MKPTLRVVLSVVALGHCALSLPTAWAELVGRWAFDGDTLDASGNDLHGERVNDPQFSDDTPEPLAGGQSLSFSGGSHVLVAHNDLLTITDAITISAWVKPVGEVTWDGIIAKNPSDGSQSNHAGNYELRIENGTRVLTFLYQQGADNDTMGHASAPTVPTDTWSHVLITAASGGDLNVYLNGELADTVPINDTFGVPNTASLFIGSRADNFTPFDGLIDEVLLYNEVVDEATIELLANGSIDDAPDTDRDGLPDFYENRFAFLDPDNAADAAMDQDGDGLTNLEEFNARTNPENPDTDGDGLGDGVETNTGIYVSAEDTGTNPLLADTDQDGLSDGVETNSGTFNGADDPGTSPVDSDSDGDTFGDLVEILLGSNPLDPNDMPAGIVLQESQGAGENWNTPESWTGGQAPMAGSNYLVVGTVAPVLRSPGSADPVFAGDRLNLLGEETELRLLHSGTARVSDLGIDGGTLIKDRSGRLGLGGPGDTLTVTQNVTIAFAAAGELVLGSTLTGGAGLHVVPTNELLDASQAVLTVTSGNPAFTGDWTVERTTLKGAGVDAIGQGNIFLLDGRLDLDYNLNLVGGRLNIDGESSRIVLDQTLAFGEMTILEGTVPIPEGVYTYESLADILDGGLQPIFVDGGGRLIIGPDTDADGLPDAWETEVFGDLSQTGDGDGDADGLTNAREYSAGTDPDNPDSDGDGLSDQQEVEVLGSNPLSGDTDGDGLGDAVETNTGTYVSAEDTGTDPTKADTDGDGLADGVENNSGTFVSAEDPGTDPNKADTDGDGASDGQEVSVGTDPHDPEDFSTLPAGTVAAWTFDAEAAVQPDISGMGHDATVHGAAWVNDAERGGVMAFEGEAYLEVAHSAALSLTEAFTIAAWVNVENYDSWRGVIGKSEENLPAPYDLYFVQGGDGRARFYVGDGDESLGEVTATDAPETGVWQHVAVTFDNGEIRHFLNGMVNGEGSLAVTLGDTEKPFRIGNRNDLVTQMLGRMDEVILLNRALSEEEVALVMQGISGGPVDPGEDPEGFVIHEVSFDDQGALHIGFGSEEGESYALEFSVDLVEWEIVVADIPSDGSQTTISYTPDTETFPSGFVRVQLKP